MIDYSFLQIWWLRNAPVAEVAAFCRDYGYEVVILNANKHRYRIKRIKEEQE